MPNVAAGLSAWKFAYSSSHVAMVVVRPGKLIDEKNNENLDESRKLEMRDSKRSPFREEHVSVDLRSFRKYLRQLRDGKYTLLSGDNIAFEK